MSSCRRVSDVKISRIGLGERELTHVVGAEAVDAQIAEHDVVDDVNGS